MEKFNFTPMCDIRTSVHSVSIYSSTCLVETNIGLVSSVIEWPCIYVNTDQVDSCIELSMSQDEFVGYVARNTDASMMELFLTEHMINDDVCLEICSLWAILLNSKYANCAVQVNCHRRSMWYEPDVINGRNTSIFVWQYITTPSHWT